MKKFICIILFASLHLFCRAQNVFDTETPPDMEGSNSSLSSDSIPESNVPHFRHTWQWERNGVYKREVALDTLMDGIQNFNTIFKKNISNTYLGNFPSPYLSNIFITRETVQDFYPLTQIRAFLFKPEDATFQYDNPFHPIEIFYGRRKRESRKPAGRMACTKYPPLVECRYSLPADFQRRSLYEPKSQSVSFFFVLVL